MITPHEKSLSKSQRIHLGELCYLAIMTLWGSGERGEREGGGREGEVGEVGEHSVLPQEHTAELTDLYSVKVFPQVANYVLMRG